MPETRCANAEFGVLAVLQTWHHSQKMCAQCSTWLQLPSCKTTQWKTEEEEEVVANIPSSRPDSQRLTVTTKVFKRSKAGGYSVGGHSGSVGGQVKSRLAPRPPPPTEETLRMTFHRVPEDLWRIPDKRFIFSKAEACRDTFIWNRRAVETNHDVLRTNVQATHWELHWTPCLYVQLYRKQATREETAGDRHTRQMPRQQQPFTEHRRNRGDNLETQQLHNFVFING